MKPTLRLTRPTMKLKDKRPRLELQKKEMQKRQRGTRYA